MHEPVFVIHGVGNRDRAGFTATVAALREATGVSLEPVYWGDLGADDRHVDLAVPAWPPAAVALRDDLPGKAPTGADTDGDPPGPALAALLADSAPGYAAPEQPGGLRGEEGAPSPLRQALRRHLADAADIGAGSLRDEPEGPDPEHVLEVLDEVWRTARWLPAAGDPELLAQAGAALAEAALDVTARGGAGPNDTSWDGLRGSAADAGRLRAVLQRRLAELDRVAGAAMQAVAARVNHGLRTRLGPGVTRFLGDVLVYQRHRQAIQDRVRESIEAIDPGLGRTPDRPVRVVAHSLGGVIAVDLATGTAPLWTESLLTFGSQAAYFHLCDPRGGQLAAYAHPEPVTLPASLGRWTNLWQPLDVLAFAASRVFRLSDGTAPRDVPLRHTASAGLWTHSVYWELPDLASAIRDAMLG